MSAMGQKLARAATSGLSALLPKAAAKVVGRGVRYGTIAAPAIAENALKGFASS